MKVQESFDKRDSLGNKPFFFGSVIFFVEEKKYLIFSKKKIKFDQIWSNLIKFDQNHVFDQIWSNLIFLIFPGKKISIVFLLEGWISGNKTLEIFKYWSLGFGLILILAVKELLWNLSFVKRGMVHLEFLQNCASQKNLWIVHKFKINLWMKKNLRNPSQQKNLKVIHPQKIIQLIFLSPIPFTPKKNLTSFKLFAGWTWSSPRYLISFPFCQRKSNEKTDRKQKHPTRRQKGWE